MVNGRLLAEESTYEQAHLRIPRELLPPLASQATFLWQMCVLSGEYKGAMPTQSSIEHAPCTVLDPAILSSWQFPGINWSIQSYLSSIT